MRARTGREVGTGEGVWERMGQKLVTVEGLLAGVGREVGTVGACGQRYDRKLAVEGLWARAGRELSSMEGGVVGEDRRKLALGRGCGQGRDGNLALWRDCGRGRDGNLARQLNTISCYICAYRQKK